jgi:hypothetical protein
MTYHPKFIRDSMGRQRAVQISLREWRSIEQKLKEGKFLGQLQKDLDEGFEDARLHLQGKKKLKTAREVLAEL